MSFPPLSFLLISLFFHITFNLLMLSFLLIILDQAEGYVRFHKVEVGFWLFVIICVIIAMVTLI